MLGYIRNLRLYRDAREIPAPTLVPDQPIDRTHLFKMTLGDRSLEAEVLRLFERQSGDAAGPYVGCRTCQATRAGAYFEWLGARHWRLARWPTLRRRSKSPQPILLLAEPAISVAARRRSTKP